MSYAGVDDAAYLQSIGRVRQAQGAAIVALVREHVSSGDWLDVGCGFGYVLAAVREAACSILPLAARRSPLAARRLPLAPFAWLAHCSRSAPSSAIR
jgi:hypothetical protein